MLANCQIKSLSSRGGLRAEPQVVPRLTFVLSGDFYDMLAAASSKRNLIVAICFDRVEYQTVDSQTAT